MASEDFGEKTLIAAMQEARERLSKEGSFSPFAVALMPEEHMRIVEGAGAENSEEVRDLIIIELTRLVEGGLEAYAMCSDTNVKLEDEDGLHDAIQVEMEVRNETPMCGYQLYIQKEGEYLFADIEAYNGNSIIFK